MVQIYLDKFSPGITPINPVSPEGEYTSNI